jgi:hypothetical protein
MTLYKDSILQRLDQRQFWNINNNEISFYKHSYNK